MSQGPTNRAGTRRGLTVCARVGNASLKGMRKLDVSFYKPCATGIEIQAIDRPQVRVAVSFEGKPSDHGMAPGRQGLSLAGVKKFAAEGAALSVPVQARLPAGARVNSPGLPRASLDLVLYWGSLGLSALAVVLFLWLMRERRRDR
jgi:hypothetical protein